MRRVPPSTVVREEIDQLLSQGLEREANLLSELAELGLRYLVQQGLEQEQTDSLGRAHYQRRSDDHRRRGYRNGYEDAGLKTAEGKVAVKVPQVRGSEDPYRSRLMEFLDGNSDVLERLVVEMYARGLSTRDVEDCFRDATGALLISKSAVTEITDQLWDDYQAFAPGTYQRSRSLICSWTGSTRACAATAPRRASSVPGASPKTAERSCSISPSATRSPRPAGPSSCETWLGAASRPRPLSPAMAPRGFSTRSPRSSPSACASAAGSTR